MNRWFGNNSRVHRLGSKLLQVFTNNYNKNYNIHRPPSTYSYFQPLRKPTQPRSKRWPLFLLLAGATSGSSLWLGKTIFAESNMEESTENVWNVLADENNDHKDLSPSVLAPRSSTSSSSSPTLVLFEMESCPYCKRIRVALDYYRLPYSCVPVTAIGRKELRTTNFSKVPVLVVNGMEYNNSFAALWKIQEFVSADVREDERTIPAIERKWLYRVDDRWIPLITPNIAHTLSESYQSMKYLLSVDRYSWYERWSVNWLGPFFLYAMGKKRKWSLGIKDERQELFQQIEEWMADVGDNLFLLGERPCLADLCVFAFLKTLQPFDVMTDIKAHTNVMSWFHVPFG
ncbi:hypothetical protein GAYE_SCF72G6969 [Galdieria yellowstonensis]|uniref:Prostaglandin-E synthase n=1 Tax=Galdieria yellowstonensis TaxID=3028027 RepID=A0AAV9IP58_9RHOD|nr:hypothetical protein GAYE_SCF72G6969 [Galdieria yellowstonensis]